MYGGMFFLVKYYLFYFYFVVKYFLIANFGCLRVKNEKEQVR